ncbi:hypothetical protein LVD15_20930 [Fulvivirga maritima]|uniref:transketolase-like TK C-terminal-containing protein n=1 Tax=Fulvivirga maritima TaxID=2904247 RepID=UPI001F3C34AA|nr:hypothetical protein [Fulvivirga maritima]UII25748.1 hypothetical protein LVD15_20930 [Fulvivirga maritima]
MSLTIKKKFSLEEIKDYRDKLEIPLTDEKLKDYPFYRFEEDSDEVKYIKQRRKNLLGQLPNREVMDYDFKMPSAKIFKSFDSGSGEKEATTNGAFMQLLSSLLKDKNTTDHIVPIIPDESRTLGLDALFGNVGIYNPKGQQYDPVDGGSLLQYNEKKKGVILEEGITEAGAISTFIAAGTHHNAEKLYTIPFFMFYSMFGFQRISDLIWAALDARTRGFMIGGIAGRTSLSGEGLQHQDGQGHLFALAFPHLEAYDPAFAYETSAIIKKGIQRMYQKKEDLIYYITVNNDSYPMPRKPSGVDQGIIDGLYCYKEAKKNKSKNKVVNLLGSGAIMKEVLAAAEILEDEFEIPVSIWSVTSYKKLYDNARDSARMNNIEGKKEQSLTESAFSKNDICIAATDYVKALPLSISSWMPENYTVLGTDGFGLSDTVNELRHHFEVDAIHIAWTALHALYNTGDLNKKVLNRFKDQYKIKKGKNNPTEY